MNETTAIVLFTLSGLMITLGCYFLGGPIAAASVLLFYGMMALFYLASRLTN